MWNAVRRGWTAGYALQIVGPEGDRTTVVLLASVQDRGTHVEQDVLSEEDSESVWSNMGNRGSDEDEAWREPELVAEETLNEETTGDRDRDG